MLKIFSEKKLMKVSNTCIVSTQNAKAFTNFSTSLCGTYLMAMLAIQNVLFAHNKLFKSDCMMTATVGYQK